MGIIAVFSDTTSIFIVDMACAMSGATEKWLVFIVHCSVANVARVLSKFGRLHIYSLPLYVVNYNLSWLFVFFPMYTERLIEVKIRKCL